MKPSFEVVVVVSGLCMLTPARDGTAMHVLMPRVDHDMETQSCSPRTPEEEAEAHAGHAPHFAWLAWDAAHEQPGAAAVSGCMRDFELTGHRVRLRHPDGGAVEPTVDARRVLTLEPRVCFSGVSDAVLDPDPSALLSTRVDLASGRPYARLPYLDDFGNPFYDLEEPTACGGRGRKERRRAAYAAVWSLGRFDAPVSVADLLAMTPFAGGAAVALPEPAGVPLHPVDGLVVLRVLHVVEKELPTGDPNCRALPTPEGPGTAHFGAYYRLAVPAKGRCVPKIEKPDLRADAAAAPEEEGAVDDLAAHPALAGLQSLRVGATCMIVRAAFR